jgi:hypothetical protein
VAQVASASHHSAASFFRTGFAESRALFVGLPRWKELLYIM